jgi:hypothetical protein
MLIETMATPFVKARTANSTDSSFPSKIPTGTEPTGTGVIEMVGNGLNSGMPSGNCLLLLPYGTGSNNDTFNMRVIGWSVIGNDPITQLWVPTILAEVACTLCGAVGVAGKLIVAAERFVDTITITTGNAGVGLDVVSPTGDVIGSIMVDAKGSQKVEITFDIVSGTTDMNCLYRKF